MVTEGGLENQFMNNSERKDNIGIMEKLAADRRRLSIVMAEVDKYSAAEKGK